ncbi:myb domain-containing protein [Tieghemostelium lacteum]|uniref:Myb domain-containing protein n=1 Tax=Tieghemostelium lacteum TaxID=361077 RepID=A0A151ZA77_TIELA|nr:myb domain-containing protein [Tieghemostelium lacteum]|eukprot:KYQ90845.1 myb domain-containing protein [Tieghemostelium lacteum]
MMDSDEDIDILGDSSSSDNEIIREPQNIKIAQPLTSVNNNNNHNNNNNSNSPPTPAVTTTISLKKRILDNSFSDNNHSKSVNSNLNNNNNNNLKSNENSVKKFKSDSSSASTTSSTIISNGMKPKINSSIGGKSYPFPETLKQEQKQHQRQPKHQKNESKLNDKDDSKSKLTREAWSKEQHNLFLRAVNLYDKDYKKIQEHVQTKTLAQVRSHAQKYFKKLQEQEGKSTIIPKPVYNLKRHTKASTHNVPWSDIEKDLFIQALKLYGKGSWKEISNFVKSRTIDQVRNHSRKYFARLKEKKQQQQLQNKKSKKPIITPKHSSSESSSDSSISDSESSTSNSDEDDTDLDILNDSISENNTIQNHVISHQNNINYNNNNNNNNNNTTINEDDIDIEGDFEDNDVDINTVDSTIEPLSTPTQIKIDNNNNNINNNINNNNSNNSDSDISITNDDNDDSFPIPHPVEYSFSNNSKNEKIMNLNEITKEEKESCREFFVGTPTKTPERYVKIRAKLIEQWKLSKPYYLSKTAARSNIKDCGDVNAIGRVHDFLESIGAINYNAIGRKKTHYKQLPSYSGNSSKYSPMSPQASIESPKSPLSFLPKSLNSWDLNKISPHTPRRRNMLPVVQGSNSSSKDRDKSKKSSNSSDKRPTRSGKKMYTLKNNGLVNDYHYHEFGVDDEYENDPFTLVPCERFTAEMKQPFTLDVSSNSLILMDIHSHISRAEVIGLLAGRYHPERKHISVHLAIPCTSKSSDIQCEMDLQSMVQARELVSTLSLEIVGWYHSHPNFEAIPSVRDIETQSDYQKLFGRDHIKKDAIEPFIGIIVNPFCNNHSGQIQDLSSFNFITINSKDNTKPYQLNFKKTVCTNYLYLQDQIKSVCDQFKNHSQKIDLSKLVASNKTYLDKMILSVQENIRLSDHDSSIYSHKSLLKYIRSVFTSFSSNASGSSVNGASSPSPPAQVSSKKPKAKYMTSVVQHKHHLQVFEKDHSTKYTDESDDNSSLSDSSNEEDQEDSDSDTSSSASSSISQSKEESFDIETVDSEISSGESSEEGFLYVDSDESSDDEVYSDGTPVTTQYSSNVYDNNSNDIFNSHYPQPIVANLNHPPTPTSFSFTSHHHHHHHHQNSSSNTNNTNHQHNHSHNTHNNHHTPSTYVEALHEYHQSKPLSHLIVNHQSSPTSLISLSPLSPSTKSLSHNPESTPNVNNDSVDIWLAPYSNPTNNKKDDDIIVD